MATPNIAAVRPVIPPAPHLGPHAPQGGENPEAGMAMQHSMPEEQPPALAELASQADKLMDQMSQVMAQHPNPKQSLLLNYSRRFLHAAVAQSLAPGKTPAPAEGPGTAETQQVPA